MHSDPTAGLSLLGRAVARLRSAPRLAAVASAIFVAALVVPALAIGRADKVKSTTFSLYPNPGEINCLAAPGQTPTATATITRGKANDTLALNLAGFKPHLAFDLFTIQNSNQHADGSPVTPFPGFGLAWYQSDVQVGADGTASVKVKTILLDQIFGFDPLVGLAPTNTFHLGFWFNNPADASTCVPGTTPFNGEHNAGPLAFITRPSAQTNLGPLCTDPTNTNPATCNP
jgi:hypothetical protein